MKNDRNQCCSCSCGNHTDDYSEEVRRTDSMLTLSDRMTHIKARLGFNRMGYVVDPGLYCLGNPGSLSPVFVTANYRLSFDTLRKSLNNMDAWILVLDTKGVNVWCAAGKGFFSTHELIRRIQITQLKEKISHKNIILPQLGAPGISAHIVTKETGLNIKYGPVCAKDIQKYMNNSMKADEHMRQVTFSFFERVILAPVELKQVLKYLPVIFFILLIFNLPQLEHIFQKTYGDFIPFVLAVLSGTLLFPALLPWLPGRAFALKGLILGVFVIGIYNIVVFDSIPESLFTLLTTIPVVSFLALNFTGCSTYTSLSGVIKEMKTYLPVIATSMICGILLRIIYIFKESI